MNDHSDPKTQYIMASYDDYVKDIRKKVDEGKMDKLDAAILLLNKVQEILQALKMTEDKFDNLEYGHLSPKNN